MSYQYLLDAVEDKVATVSLHRPDKGNALAPRVLEETERMQEWLFRTYIGSDDNHQRIEVLQAQLAAARKK